MTPIFIVGPSRSGTTLLYSLLLTSGEFPIYQAETRLIDSCPMRYGSLRNEQAYRRFIRDWTHSKQFYRSGLDERVFRREAENHRSSYPEFLAFFMSRVASQQGKSRWVEQTPGNVMHIPLLVRAFPHAKFIHIVRDGRDVAISRRKLGWSGTKSSNALRQLFYAAINWERAVLAGHRHKKSLQERFLEIKYEDLVLNTEATIAQLNHFADIRIQPQVVQTSEIGSLGKSNSAFDKGKTGISPQMVQRWKKTLSDRERALVEFTVGATLQMFGYEVYCNGEEPAASRLRNRFDKHAYLARYHLKRFAKEHTLLGRYAATELEIGQR